MPTRDAQDEAASACYLAAPAGTKKEGIGVVAGLPRKPNYLVCMRGRVLRSLPWTAAYKVRISQVCNSIPADAVPTAEPINNSANNLILLLFAFLVSQFGNRIWS